MIFTLRPPEYTGTVFYLSLFVDYRYQLHQSPIVSSPIVSSLRYQLPNKGCCSSSTRLDCFHCKDTRKRSQIFTNDISSLLPLSFIALAARKTGTSSRADKQGDAVRIVGRWCRHVLVRPRKAARPPKVEADSDCTARKCLHL